MTFAPLNDESPYLGSTSTIGGMAQPRYSGDFWTPALHGKRDSLVSEILRLAAEEQPEFVLNQLKES